MRGGGSEGVGRVKVVGTRGWRRVTGWEGVRGWGRVRKVKGRSESEGSWKSEGSQGLCPASKKRKK